MIRASLMEGPHSFERRAALSMYLAVLANVFAALLAATFAEKYTHVCLNRLFFHVLLITQSLELRVEVDVFRVKLGRSMVPRLAHTMDRFEWVTLLTCGLLKLWLRGKLLLANLIMLRFTPVSTTRSFCAVSTWCSYRHCRAHLRLLLQDLL